MKNYFYVLITAMAWLLTFNQGLGGIAFFSIEKNGSGKDNPVELGKVNWMRNFDQVQSRAKAEHKPIFILFQEVPGCQTCQSFGSRVLSHPFIVDAIESYFIPVAVYNNIGGQDRQILNLFNEPSWNNPVVRIIDSDQTALTQRFSNDYSLLGLSLSIQRALTKIGKPTPAYLDFLIQELQATELGTKEATFAMYCFWTGERKLGARNGVIGTKAGFMDGHEVVEVHFDPKLISMLELVNYAKSQDCASHVFVETKSQLSVVHHIMPSNKVSLKSKFKPDRESKYFINRSLYRYLPMTKTQASRVNAELGLGNSPDALLAPSQLALFSIIKEAPGLKWKNTVDAPDFMIAWNQAVFEKNMSRSK